MEIKRNSIIAVSLLLEGFLAVIFFVWASYKGFAFNLYPSLDALYLGALFSLPLFLFSIVFFGPLADKLAILSGCKELREKVVRPLAKELSPLAALVIACFAGFGEELFFRGLALNELGAILSSVLFSLIHFGFAVRYYIVPAILYFGIGYYFTEVATGYGLWVAIFAHIIYDFVALVYMGRKKRSANASD